MQLNLDAVSLTLSCPKCGYEIQETIGRLKDDPDIICLACRTLISVDLAQLRGVIEEPSETFDQFGWLLRDGIE